jgi:hypothetical protein
MRGEFLVNGMHVYVDPTIPGDGGLSLDAAIAVPFDVKLQINGSPVIEQNHEFVQKKSEPGSVKAQTP